MKTIKAILHKLIPSFVLEIIKLNYYNFKNKTYHFSKRQSLYITHEKGLWKATTLKPLYFLVHDIDKYEAYYHIKKGDVVFDAGANEGALSIIYAKKVGKEGKVFSFEPDAINIKLLNKNLSFNTEIEHIRLIEKGLWDEEAEIDFFEAGSVGSSMFYEDKNSKRVSIKAISIDSFIANENITKLDFIKMDIEGAEIKALKGAVNTIKKFQPNFAIASYHLVEGKLTHIAVEEFFKSINYPFKTVFYDDSEIITYAGSSVLK
ncbi:FkbM family methyltransferase [Jejuia pallidilutea]|uniref:Methyltransferase n=1 Tax=Jejuia pallidilutea TaxID=504487 RepID=A0A090VUF2_9FLAO|nr:FkbM family methyltransferase [Jejuia pallidilutea]GAL67603.1 methyltransferase FkbM family [Jejuia pallidilutea]GAL71410.1 methyltransferase [Jejuia pallidilutea]GAL89423.1 methyltransferase [Jejuia pallidilutea]